MMRVRSRRRTLYSVGAALGLAGMVFMYFQFFSMEAMDIHRQRTDGKAHLGKGPSHNINTSGNKKPSRDSIHSIKNQKMAHEIKQDNLKHDFVRPPSDIAQAIDSNLNAIKLDKNNIPVNKDSEVECKDDECRGAEPGRVLGVKMDSLNDKPEEGAGLMDDNDLEAEPQIGQPGVDFPRGISRDLVKKYKADAQNMFSCLHSDEKVPFSQVNDDYCDCMDGSDEPGTSACPHTRFFCSFQSRGVRLHDIPSSKVNDGVCDCCDGSDEWKNITLPSHVALGDNLPHYGVYQVPCRDRCEKQIALAKEDLVMHRKGAQIKDSYIKEGQQHSNPNQLYGAQSEFYKLSQNCYKIRSDKYEYSVCPFKEVIQQDFPSSTTNIGKIPEWVKTGTSLTLKMTRGDAKQCPGRIHRETFLKFQCGLTDQVLSVQETEVCQYTIAFATPAAC